MSKKRVTSWASNNCQPQTVLTSFDLVPSSKVLGNYPPFFLYKYSFTLACEQKFLGLLKMDSNSSVSQCRSMRLPADIVAAGHLEGYRGEGRQRAVVWSGFMRLG